MIRNLVPLAGAAAFVAALVCHYLARDRAMQRRANAEGNRVLADLYAGTDAEAVFRARAAEFDRDRPGRDLDRRPVQVGRVVNRVVVDIAAAQLARRDGRLTHPTVLTVPGTRRSDRRGGEW